MEMNKELIVSDLQRIEYPDEQWYCPNCGKKALVRFEYGTRIIRCVECGEFVVSIILKLREEINKKF